MLTRLLEAAGHTEVRIQQRISQLCSFLWKTQVMLELWLLEGRYPKTLGFYARRVAETLPRSFSRRLRLLVVPGIEKSVARIFWMDILRGIATAKTRKTFRSHSDSKNWRFFHAQSTIVKKTIKRNYNYSAALLNWNFPLLLTYLYIII